MRIINLETSITGGGDPWPHKGIHSRMHPAEHRLPHGRPHRLLLPGQ